LHDRVRRALSQAHLLDQLHAAGMASQASWLTFRCRDHIREALDRTRKPGQGNELQHVNQLALLGSLAAYPGRQNEPKGAGHAALHGHLVGDFR